MNWQDLTAKIRNYAPKEWRHRDFELFFEIETILHFYETLIADGEKRPVREAWALLSGYHVPGIDDQAVQRQQSLKLRQHLQYIKTASSWRWWLDWYRTQPDSIRLYQFLQSPNDELLFNQTYGVLLYEDRLTAYGKVFSSSPDRRKKRKPVAWAVAGDYQFELNNQWVDVKIPEAFAGFAENPWPMRDLPRRTQSEAIKINLERLLEIALKLDLCEQEKEILPRGNWHDRLSKLRFESKNQNGQFEPSHMMELNGLFHLAGALGIGKSTLIWILTYYLAYEGQHVTVMLNTVIETIRLAVWLRQMGISAAPALGRNRAEHERKYGLANADALSVTRIFQPPSPDKPAEPVLSWMPTPCALSGTQAKPIPVSSEPCFELRDKAGKRHICPLLPVCPVHNLSRDLIQSKVWIVNPMSFLYSFAPQGVGEERTRLLEAIYRLSDVFIVDEADRVQTQWDRVFAPVRPVAGSDEAVLDKLHRKLGEVSGGTWGRQRAGEAVFNRLTNTDDNANTLTNRVFRLMKKHPYLARWIKNFQITNPSLFNRLLASVMKFAPPEPDEDAKKQLEENLRAEFRRFWSNPLRRKGNDLTKWVNDLLGADVKEKVLQKDLERWLINQMCWKEKLNSRQKKLVRKLEFAVTLSAMIKRANDIFYQLNWIEDEIGDIESGSFNLSTAVTDLVPDSPLGVVLGLRLIDYVNGRNLGVFNALRYRGIGRWLLLNFHRLYEDQDGTVGPHVLVTSATSWLPGSAQFHLAVEPHGVLLPKETPTNKIELLLRQPKNRIGNWIHVSGTGNRRENNLRSSVKQLANGDFQDELDYWQGKGEKRRILLIVSSYEQTTWVQDELQKHPQWQNRVVRLLPDDAELLDESTIRAREVERLWERDADILIAPLMAIQRGFNILDEMEDGALLGSIFFLVRPYPPPDDLSPQIMSLNAWLMNQLQEGSRTLTDGYSELEMKAMRELRKRANQRWIRLLQTTTRGLAKMDDDFYNEFIRDQFIVIWQTIGRLLRGGRDARVVFCDAAFVARKEGRRHMLRDWHDMLEALINTNNETEKQLAKHLYQLAWNTFETAAKNRRIF